MEDTEATTGQVPEPPAEDQSTIASERQRVIAGDSGLYEQQPQVSSGDSANTPLRSSPLPAALQSGTPLAEDREEAAAADEEPDAADEETGEEPE